MRVRKPSYSGLDVSIAYLFILLFVYAAVSKLLEFQDFQTQLGQSPLLGAFAVPISYAVIIVELVTAVFLVLERTRRLGLIISFVLMVMFTVYIIIILNFTSFTPCSCGGVLEDLGWTEHLVFNMVFIALAIAGLFLSHNIHFKKQLFHYLGLSLLGSAIVIALFLFSEKEIKRNNAFQRKYMPHGLEEIGNFQLESNAFYIAGVDDSLIYLGNYNAPLYLKAISRDLKRSKEIKVEIEDYELPYKRVRIDVESPYFFVGDGTVPVLFRGNTKDWNAKTFSKNDAYFYQFQVIDSLRLVFTTTSTKTQSTMVGELKKEKDSVYIQLHEKILKAQFNDIFDTDGLLMWNSQRKQALYVYYYRNQYETADSEFDFLFTGKTIDTISRAQLDVAHYKKEDAYKLGKATVVNRTASVWGDQLYVNSSRLGKYESEEVLRSASILDCYNIATNEYSHSFYFYHQPDQILREFKVVRDTVFGLVGDQLRIQKIQPKYYRE
ncbi:DoxX family protein [Moheibacter sp.]|uniref:DoxX family protein n=1 Tax=Moheibacter sp. TaxID=1965316 RepID=UPI003C77B389